MHSSQGTAVSLAVASDYLQQMFRSSTNPLHIASLLDEVLQQILSILEHESKHEGSVVYFAAAEVVARTAVFYKGCFRRHLFSEVYVDVRGNPMCQLSYIVD